MKTDTNEIKIPLLKYLRYLGLNQKTLNIIGKDVKLMSALHKHLKIDMSHKDTIKVVEKYVKDYTEEFGIYNNSTRKYEK